MNSFRMVTLAITLVTLLTLSLACTTNTPIVYFTPAPATSQPKPTPERQSKPVGKATTLAITPTPLARPSPERLTLAEATSRARSHIAQLGYPNAALWQVDIGRDFGRDGRAIWELRFYDPASKRQILFSFDRPTPEAVVGKEPLPQPKDFPIGDIAPSEKLASRNPDIWRFVDSLPMPRSGPRAIVSVGIAPFRGPSPWYEYDKKAWLISVDYPTDEEEGRVLLESRRFWAALNTGDPIYDEAGRIYDRSGKALQ